MSTNQSQNVQTVLVILAVPQEFHKILQMVAGAYNRTVEAYTIDHLRPK